jgi:hypothetical protein
MGKAVLGFAIGVVCMSGMVGCSSSGGLPMIGSSSGTETAPQAWASLRNETNAGNFIGTFSGHSELGTLLSQEEKRANEEADRAMSTPLPATAINQMVDDMAQYIVRELPNTPEVKNAPTRVVLAFGDLIDASHGNNPAVEQALETLRNKIFLNENMKANFVFVSTSESNAKKLSDQIAGGDTSAFRDPLQRTADDTKPFVYNPASIFVITGRLYGLPDAVHHSVQISLSMQFDNVQSRGTIASKQFLRTYMWHPKRHEWEAQN